MSLEPVQIGIGPFRGLDLPGCLCNGPASRRSVNREDGPPATVLVAEVDEQRLVVVLDPQSVSGVARLVENPRWLGQRIGHERRAPSFVAWCRHCRATRNGPSTTSSTSSLRTADTKIYLNASAATRDRVIDPPRRLRPRHAEPRARGNVAPVLPCAAVSPSAGGRCHQIRRNRGGGTKERPRGWGVGHRAYAHKRWEVAPVIPTMMVFGLVLGRWWRLARP
jgi:hypothetical protein